MKAPASIALVVGFAVGALGSATAAPGSPSPPPRPAAGAPAPPAARPATPPAAKPPAARPGGVRQVTTVEGITEHVLGNGLRVLLFPDPSKETVTVNLTYLVGSRMEGYGETGMAHLLEHMLFKGSPKHPMLDEVLPRGTKQHTFQQLKDQWDVLEAQVNFVSQPGVLDVNIQTTRDNFASVLALVDEVLRQPSFPQDQFDIMIKENLTMFEDQKSDPQAQAFVTMQRALWPYPTNHPLYTATVDEQIAGLKALRIAEVKKFAAMLGTSNATMSIVGDVDTAKVKPWIEKTWGSWKSPRPWKRIERKYTSTTGGDQSLDFSDKANAMIATAHAVDIKDDDPEAPAMAAASYMLGGGGFVSRILTRLRQKDGLSYGAFSQIQLVPLDAAGGFVSVAFLNPENAKKGMAAMLEEITRFVSGGTTAEELAGAKKGILEAFERNLSNDPVVLNLLNDGLYLERKMDYWIKRNAAIGALTVEQVNAAVKRRLKPDSLVKITSGDKKKM